VRDPRRIAANIAKLPELVRKLNGCVPFHLCNSRHHNSSQNGRCFPKIRRDDKKIKKAENDGRAN
jgi:hypothetical protein